SWRPSLSTYTLVNREGLSTWCLAVGGAGLYWVWGAASAPRLGASSLGTVEALARQAGMPAALY
ncbi:MAG: hypothetical protein ACOCWJ_03465, partial [Verrucomicrobiota bacterium]